MQGELEEIVLRMNEFSKKYECELELETCGTMYASSREFKVWYKLNAIKPSKVIAKA